MKKRQRPFWEEKKLDEMTTKEWESLCDGCGRCCLNKIEETSTGKIYYTNVACKLFDPNTCRCSDYPSRMKKVSDCIKLNPQKVKNMPELPSTCAYKLLAQGKSLKPWHPLIAKNQKLMKSQGILARNTISEDDIDPDKLEDYIIKSL